MICPYCKSKVPAKGAYCSYCGERILGKEAQIEKAQRTERKVMTDDSEVWISAFAPILGIVLFLYLGLWARLRVETAAFTAGSITIAFTIGLLVLDWYKLKGQGFNLDALPLAMVLITPYYLFRRAFVVNGSVAPGVVWFVCFIIAAFIWLPIAGTILEQAAWSDFMKWREAQGF